MSHLRTTKKPHSLSSFFVTTLALMPTLAFADPPGPVFNDPIPPVFCIRITDIERVNVNDGSLDNDFTVQFELLNWSNISASGFTVAASSGTTSLVGTNPTIYGAGIDRDGRGGPLGGDDIDAKGAGLTSGDGTFDPVAIHSGRGRGDIAGNLNDWSATSFNATSARWGEGIFGAAAGTALLNRDLVAAGAPGGMTPTQLIPGLGLDALGDSAIDGGPTPYTLFGAGQPVPDGTGNVLDGLTLTITDWDVGERLTLNWFLYDADGNPIGSVGSGLPGIFGFGSLNLVRIPVGSALPGGVLQSSNGPNTGFTQASNIFYDGVFRVPNPAEFAAEMGVGLTANFINPEDNFANVQTNASVVPLPASAMLFGSGLIALFSTKRNNKTNKIS
ncbi:MAG: hypothetical protein V3T17_16290 [Pseudomonadales bacterium]